MTQEEIPDKIDLKNKSQEEKNYSLTSNPVDLSKINQKIHIICQKKLETEIGE